MARASWLETDSPKKVTVRDEAHQRYRDSEPKQLNKSSVDLPPQTKFFNANVPLNELTEEHLWIGGSSTPKTIIKMIRLILHLERELKVEIRSNKNLRVRIERLERKLSERSHGVE